MSWHCRADCSPMQIFENVDLNCVAKTLNAEGTDRTGANSNR